VIGVSHMRLARIGQTTLFPGAESTGVASAANNYRGFTDPCFASNKSTPVHRWVPWIAGFSRQFVHEAVGRYLDGKTGVVVDPFAGVGTTLVEALLAGHSAVGFEINPYAALACRTKVTAYEIGQGRFRKTIDDFRRHYAVATDVSYSPKSSVPPGFKTRVPFYSPDVLRKVLAVVDFIEEMDESPLRDVFRLAFAATMISCSNYSYEPSLGTRAAAGKKDVQDFPVGEAILQKLREIRTDSLWMRERVNGQMPEATVYNESFFEGGNRIEAGSVDLLITSPPYLNNYHYVRNTRPQLYWLGLVGTPGDLRRLEIENFGKYWQTVRDLDHVDFAPELIDPRIRECIEKIRSRNPDRGVYGGRGWANYATSYFNDCVRFLKTSKRMLKRRATTLVVIGNNIIQGVTIPTDRFLGSIASSIGFDLIDIHVPRPTRVGNSIIQSDVRVGGADDDCRLYEAVVELRKR